MYTISRAVERFRAWRAARASDARIPVLVAELRNAKDHDARIIALGMLACRYDETARQIRWAGGPWAKDQAGVCEATSEVLTAIRYALEAHRTGTRRPRFGDVLERRIGAYLDCISNSGTRWTGYTLIHNIADTIRQYDTQVAINLDAVCPDLERR